MNLNNLISAVAYIKDRNLNYHEMFKKHKCNVIFELIPEVENNLWNVNIIINSSMREIFEKLLAQKKMDFDNLIIKLVIID